VRVISGRSRGRRLSATLPPAVRPTSDRVREAIFDIIGSLGGVGDLDVVDLFCGSGALGIEAISRGARSVTFVDHDPSALSAVHTNLEAVGLADATVTLKRAALPEWLEGASHFDLALCDPPYAFDAWDELLGHLDAEVAVLESGHPVEVRGPWVVTRSRRYGSTIVTVVHSAPATPEPAAHGEQAPS